MPGKIQIRARFGHRRWIASGLVNVRQMLRHTAGRASREGNTWVVMRNTRSTIRAYRIVDPDFEEVVLIVRHNSTYKV